MSPVGKLLAEREQRHVKHLDDYAQRVQIADALLLLAMQGNVLANELHERLSEGQAVQFSIE